MACPLWESLDGSNRGAWVLRAEEAGETEGEGSASQGDHTSVCLDDLRFGLVVLG